MNRPIYFFDTYAFFEVIRGNSNYKKYLDTRILTTIFNLAELNYNLKKEVSRKIADEYTDKYKVFLINVSAEDVKKAMDLGATDYFVKANIKIDDVVATILKYLP